MDPLIVTVVLAAVAALVLWWFLRRRSAPPVEDEWTLPPEGTITGAGSSAPEVFDREALLRHNRVLDPSKWDNTPDAEATAETEESDGDAPGEELPRFFDREYLERRQQDGDTKP